MHWWTIGCYGHLVLTRDLWETVLSMPGTWSLYPPRPIHHWVKAVTTLTFPLFFVLVEHASHGKPSGKESQSLGRKPWANAKGMWEGTKEIYYTSEYQNLRTLESNRVWVSWLLCSIKPRILLTLEVGKGLLEKPSDHWLIYPNFESTSSESSRFVLNHTISIHQHFKV